MPTTKPKNKKPVAAKSGGRVPGKDVKKSQKADTPSVKEKKPPLKAAPPPIPMIGNQSGSLLGNYPPDFENDGKRLLAECPEFKLWELYHEGGPHKLETATSILRAEKKALFRIKGPTDGPWGKDAIMRVDRAQALYYLVRFKELECWDGALPVATRMAESFVPLIEGALKSDDPREAAEKAGESFRDAVLALARSEGKIPDRRSSHVPAVAVLIWEAQGQFQYRRERPTKNLLKTRLELIGYTIKGGDHVTRWTDRFVSAGLENLPD